MIHPSQLYESLKRHQKSLAYLLLSMPLFAIIQYTAYWLRFEGQLDASTQLHLQHTLIAVVFIKVVTFTWFRIYQGWNRYLTFYDLITLAQATVASSLVLVLAAYLFTPNVVIPRSVFLLDCFGTIIVFGGLRSMIRFIEELSPSWIPSRGRTRALIVGANDAGESILRTVRRNRQLSYQIVGFISTPDQPIDSARIGGIPVLGSVEQIERIAKRYHIAEILITAGEFSGKDVREIVHRGRAAGVAVKVLPSFEQLLSGRVDLKPRTVSIQDLLRRDPVKLDMKGLHHWIDDKVLWVTGAAGSIGSEICRQLLQFEPRRMIFIDRSENSLFFLEQELRKIATNVELEFCIADASDATRMEQLLIDHRPDIVFHAAAYKHVPLMEAHPGEAVKNIVRATQTLADLAHQHRVGSFVMISTDKAVNPTSVMGACKRVAEIYVQSLAANSSCNFVTVRFGNVLDSAGSVVPIFREQIANGGPVTVTHPDMQRYFMMIPEASQLVIQAGAMGHGGEVFVLDMGDPVRIVDLAKEMIHLSGMEVGRDIEIQFSGMRPGEKLFEELHVSGENHLPTIHPKIMVAESKHDSHQQVRAAIEQLMQAATYTPESVVDQLREIVPHYRAPVERAAPRAA
ncbi:MAG: hypothetical protein CMJ77_16780 [Planctomycetaceae bacterium]|nr:hypothetical protein [Planctomycetaceae bacterium]